MGNLLNIAMKRNVVNTDEILNKIDKAKEIDFNTTRTVKTGSGLIASVHAIIDNVNRYLGHKKDNYLLLVNEAEIADYFDKCVAFGRVAIDTETTGLDPINDDIVGFSLYAPGLKAAYIPISHRDYITNELIPNQPSREFLKSQLDRFNENDTKVIMFNSAFDLRIFRHSLNVYLTCWFDASIAARILNENEFSNRLKDLHKKYILNNQEDEFTFSALFDDVPFNLVPMTSGYLYAAKDAEVTYELFEFQYRYLNPEDEMCIQRELQDVSKLFWEIEMPCVSVLADMEDRGFTVDFEVAEELKAKYVPIMENAETKFKTIIRQYGITEEIDIASSTQLAHLFYDLLGLKSPDKKNPRGTGKEILAALEHPVVDALKEYRSVATLVNTFILKMSNLAASGDGKIHCRFLQVGADTGRLACKNPSLQNIPSHATDIRRMFKASPGYVLIGSDFSQQEPKMTAWLSQDKGLIAAAKEGKDIYSSIAAIAFNTTYEDCCENFLDENGKKTDKVNKEGKERRNNAKKIILGEQQMPLYKVIYAEKCMNSITQRCVA